MKPVHYILLTIAGIILLIALLNWEKVKALFSGASSLANGSPCATPGYIGGNNGTITNGVCIESRPLEEGDMCRTAAGTAGVITNGQCVQAASKPVQQYSNAIKITKKGGTKVFAVQSGNIVSPINAATVPEGTILTVTEYIPSPHVYYNTSVGWIDGDDATVA